MVVIMKLTHDWELLRTAIDVIFAGVLALHVHVSCTFTMGWNAAVPIQGQSQVLPSRSLRRRQSRHDKWRCFGCGRLSTDGNFLSVAPAYRLLW